MAHRSSKISVEWDWQYTGNALVGGQLTITTDGMRCVDLNVLLISVWCSCGLDISIDS